MQEYLKDVITRQQRLNKLTQTLYSTPGMGQSAVAVGVNATNPSTVAIGEHASREDEMRNTHYSYNQKHGVFQQSNSSFNNSTITISNSVIVGNNNKIIGDNNIVTGNNNKVEGDKNRVTGNNNKVSGNYNSLTGNNCKAKGTGNEILGNNAKNTSTRKEERIQELIDSGKLKPPPPPPPPRRINEGALFEGFLDPFIAIGRAFQTLFYLFFPSKKPKGFVDKSDEFFDSKIRMDEVEPSGPEMNYPGYEGGYVFYLLTKMIEESKEDIAKDVQYYIDKHELVIDLNKMNEGPLLHEKLLEKRS